ncbi:MAG: hypothetical protein C5B54_09685 [Acidobacteria bacterium]|nr:MAG: hypothetical protein C5B54_09685 [Acidobacteriota bacterium]
MAPSRTRVFQKWLEHLEFEGKTQYVRELEMWLKSFERYFHISNLPLSEEETRHSTLRDYSEELRVVGDVIFRISQICTLLLSEERVSYSSFTKYVENSLRHDYFTDAYIRRLLRQQRPSRNMTLLMEALLDSRTIILEVARLSKTSYMCFVSTGRVINREIRKGVFFDYFLDKKYEVFFDRIHSAHVLRIVRSIQVPRYKRSLAAIFLSLFRTLRYLNYIGMQMQDANALKRSLLIFSLVNAELKWLIEYLEEEYLNKEHADAHFVELIEGLAYSLSMELKKVMQRELLGTAGLQQYELIFSKIQNSQGILMNSVQQIVVAIVQYFDPRLDGHNIFPDYVTRLDQSLRLREDIYDLREAGRQLRKNADLTETSSLVKRIEKFKTGSMKYLMYKDWFEFDNFYHEVLACKTTGNLNFTLHRFDTFLTTLIKEVNKRTILQTHPFTKNT